MSDYRQTSTRWAYETFEEFLFKTNTPCYFYFQYAKHGNEIDRRFNMCNGYRSCLPCTIKNNLNPDDVCPTITWPDTEYADTPISLQHYLENNILNHYYGEFGPYIEIDDRDAPCPILEYCVHLYRFDKPRLMMQHINFYWDMLKAMEPLVNINFENKGRFNNVIRSKHV